MARARHRPERDTTEIASDGLDRLLRPSVPRTLISPLEGRTEVFRLSDIEDRRRFDPTRSVSVPRAMSGIPSRVVEVPKRDPRAALGKKPEMPPGRFRFDDPSMVVMCARRKERREVLFATRKTRKGAGSKRFRNIFSDVGCK